MGKFFSENLFMNRLLYGQPVLSGEMLPKSGQDFFLACHARRDHTGRLDWLSAYLPCADANQCVLSGFNIGVSVPVIAALCAQDPFRTHAALLAEVDNRNFAGVCNFPSVGMMDGSLRASLEEQEMGYQIEVEFIKRARNENIFTLAMAFSESQAMLMLNAGADAILLHPGLEDEDSYIGKLQMLIGQLPPTHPLFICADLDSRIEVVARPLLKRGGILVTSVP